MTDFPSVVVLGNVGTTSPAVLERIEGLLTPQAFRVRLQAVLDTHGMALVAARLDMEERENVRRLREEQEQAYADAIREDTLRVCPTSSLEHQELMCWFMSHSNKKKTDDERLKKLHCSSRGSSRRTKKKLRDV